MTDYPDLIKALRCAHMGDDECGSSACPYWSGLGCMDGKIGDDAATAIEALEAEVKQLTKRNAELHAELEKWVSAAEKAGEPKRGEWIGKSNDDSFVKCSVCGHIRIGSSLWYCKQYVPYCENCGAKMEVQE